MNRTEMVSGSRWHLHVFILFYAYSSAPANGLTSHPARTATTTSRRPMPIRSQRLTRDVKSASSSSSSISSSWPLFSLSAATATSPLEEFSERIGEIAVAQVQSLASQVADSEDEYLRRRQRPPSPKTKKKKSIYSKNETVPAKINKLDGVGGTVYSNTLKVLTKKSFVSLSDEEYYDRDDDDNNDEDDQKQSAQNRGAPLSSAAKKERQVWQALANLESDMQLLDRMAGQKPQLSALEFGLLTTAVLAAASGPFFMQGQLTEFLAPSMAAFTAAIGIGAEYTGKIAVADGKEVAAASIQCAAEADGLLANAERAKAITPLCVGIGATAASFALLVPILLDTVSNALDNNLQLTTEIYLFCPLVAVLAASVASLALQETISLCNQAIGIGNRRFARSGLVGRTWMSSTEQIERKSRGSANKWKTFALSVLPAPILGALVPGALPTKTIVVSALAAAQSAYFLAEAERRLSRATDAVALKARSAAVCDTYANQGARSAAILPFTSALSSLCAAATAAVVELPFFEALSLQSSVSAMLLEMAMAAFFPACSALFAAAASVSKARCQVDAQASMLAASTIALPYDDEEQDPVLRPWNGVLELIRLTLNNSIREPLKRFWNKQYQRVRRIIGIILSGKGE